MRNAIDNSSSAAQQWLLPSRILLAYEVAPVRFGLAEALRADGHEVAEAADGYQLYAFLGLSLFGVEADPGVIVVQVDLPEFDAFHLLATLRNADVRTPVVLLDADAGELAPEFYRRCGPVTTTSDATDVEQVRASVLIANQSRYQRFLS